MIETNLKINTQWVVKKSVGFIDLYTMYGEHLTFSRKKNLLKYLILNSVYNNKKIKRKLLLNDKNLSRFKQSALKSTIDSLIQNRVLSLISNNLSGLKEKELERYKWQLEYLSLFESSIISKYRLQRRLKERRVLIIGLGGQGSIISQILASTGVGKITLIDGDKVELDNLTRQILYTEEDVGKSKAQVLAQKLIKQNSNIKVKVFDKYISTQEDADKLISKNHDFVVLCADKPLIQLREWVNAICLKKNISYLAVSGSWVGPICIPYKTACFECEQNYYRKLNPKYDEYIQLLKESKEIPRPSFAFRPLISGIVIALQVFKYISGVMKPNVLEGRFKLNTELECGFEKIPRNINCHACGAKTRN